MKSLQEIIYNDTEKWPSEKIYEMATISKNEMWGNEHYKIAVHGPESSDRPNPHIHIYLANDHLPYNKFNFEISLTDILCNDEINLIYQRDVKTHKLITHRDKCTWIGYRKIKENFEEWLYSNKVKFPGEYIDNLDAIIWNYNNENDYRIQNPLLQYISEHGLKILNKYKKYFSEEDIDKYKECFNEFD